mmetsp:Transcript_55060/g.109299  ORF Transcript_55060/g.109299 Transcript_55060/m.109299 type:complete len:200 (+) Transcript_55060:3305-3904(+)
MYLKKGSLASGFLKSSLATEVIMFCTMPVDMRSDDIDISSADGALVSGKNCAASAGSFGKQEMPRKGPKREPASRRFPDLAVVARKGRKLASLASSAPSGRSLTRACSARKCGAKSPRMFGACVFSGQSLAKRGTASSESVPSSCRRATSRERKLDGSESVRSGPSNRSTPSASASAGCGNMLGFRSAMEQYEMHSSLT